MGLRDDELRRLTEIERYLLEDDPSLARRLTERERGHRASLRVLSAVSAALVAVLGGLMLMVTSVEAASIVVLILGTGLVVGAPGALLAWWYLKSGVDR